MTCPRKDIAQWITLLPDRPWNKLSLTTVAVRSDDEATGHMIGDLGAVIASHDMQAQIEPGGTARRGQDVTVVDVKDIRVNVDLRIFPA